MSSPTSRDAASPRRIGRYILHESLGAGGMGEVYRARAFGAAGVVKDLCIKRIGPRRLERPGATDRFIAEARLSMQLVHGNIVPVFDFGRAGDEYYLAMEWVEGADLRALLHDARTHGNELEPVVAVHVAAEVARALAYAHELEDAEPIVHRDVKPGNVLISRAGDVKLTDFGVATVVGDAAAGVGGTPAYMAPEQRRGETVTPRADLYAVGVLLVEMRTGERPESLADAPVDRLEAPIAQLVRRLLQPDPEDRPPRAREVAHELERFVGAARAEGEGSPRDALADRARRLARRNGGQEGIEYPVDASLAGSHEEPAVSASTAPPDAIRAKHASEGGDAAGTAKDPPREAPSPGTSRARGRRVLVAGAALAVAAAAVVAARWTGGPGREGDGDASGAAAESPASGGRTESRAAGPAPSAPPPRAGGGGGDSGTDAAARGGSREGADRAAATPAPAADDAGAHGARPEAGRAAAQAPSATAADATAPPERRARQPRTPGARRSARASATAAEPGTRGDGPAPHGDDASVEARAGASEDDVPGTPADAGATSRDAPEEAERGRPSRTAPDNPATLDVNATPWAEVFVDGERVGVSPVFGLELSPGPHTLRFRNEPLGVERESHIELEPGEERDLVVDLK